MKKISGLRCLEFAAAASLTLSKYFLSISSILGWWLSITGYILTAILNVRIGLRIAVTITVALALLSAYGLYKWQYEIVGLQTLDLFIIALTLLFAVFIIKKEAKEKRDLWLIQSLTVLIFSAAFILLGLKLNIGWYALLIGHVNNLYLYYRKKAFMIVVTQIISIIIVILKLLS